MHLEPSAGAPHLVFPRLRVFDPVKGHSPLMHLRGRRQNKLFEDMGQRVAGGRRMTRIQISDGSAGPMASGRGSTRVVTVRLI